MALKQLRRAFSSSPCGPPTLVTSAALSAAARIIDAGPADAFARARIPHALRSPLRGDLKDPSSPFSILSPPDAALLFEALAVPAAGPTIVYDTGEALPAIRLAWLLSFYGAQRVSVLDGGFTAHIAAGGAVHTAFSSAAAPPPPPPPPLAAVAPQRRMLALRDDVLLAQGSGCSACQIIDARSPAEFAGADARGLPRVGHVPGAINVPHAALLHPGTRRFLPAEELQRLFAARGVDLARPSIVLCLAGVRAAVAAVGVQAAGGGGEVRGYGGSMPEWAEDERLPMTVLK